MFGHRLQRYVFQDNRRRLRDDRISLIVGFALSVSMLLAGASAQAAATGGLIVVAVSMFSLTIYACKNAAQVAADKTFFESKEYPLLYRPLSRRLVLLGPAVLALAAAVPQIASAALDRKLRRLTTNVPLTDDAITKIAETYQDAETFRVKLNAGLSEQAMKAGSAAASASTFNINPPSEMQGKVFSSFPEAAGSTWSFALIATNLGPDNYETIGLARQPDVAVMERIARPLPKLSGYGPAYLVVKGLTATLDGYHLKNVIFQDMHLIFHGGPLILEKVYFFDCDFELDSTEQAWRLISSVTKGTWVNFSSIP